MIYGESLATASNRIVAKLQPIAAFPENSEKISKADLSRRLMLSDFEKS